VQYVLRRLPANQSQNPARTSDMSTSTQRVMSRVNNIGQPSVVGRPGGDPRPDLIDLALRSAAVSIFEEGHQHAIVRVIRDDTGTACRGRRDIHQTAVRLSVGQIQSDRRAPTTVATRASWRKDR